MVHKGCAMRNSLINKNIVNLVSAIMIIIFVYTAVNKLKDYETFRISLRQSPILHQYSSLVSIIIPIGELFVSLLLIISTTRKAGLLLSAILMSLFTSYIGFIIVTSTNLPCNCGGVIKYLSWKEHLILNTILLILCLYAWILSRNSTKVLIAINRNRRTPA